LEIFSDILAVALLAGFLIGGFVCPRGQRAKLFGVAVGFGVPFGIFVDFGLGSGNGPNCAMFGVPLWFFIAIGIGMFAHYVFRQIRPIVIDQNAKPCAACGYDLRATPDKCPECGTIQSDQKTST
jgi:hypothetical protein